MQPQVSIAAAAGRMPSYSNFPSASLGVGARMSSTTNDYGKLVAAGGASFCMKVYVGARDAAKSKEANKLGKAGVTVH